MTLKSLLMSIIALSLFSCQNFHMEKRHYRKGFHVQWGSIKKDNKKVETEVIESGEAHLETPNKIVLPKGNESTIIIDSRDSLHFVTKEDECVEVFKNYTLATEKVNQVNESSRKDSRKDFKSEQRMQTKQKNSINTRSLFYFLLILIIPLSVFNRKAEKASKWSSKNVRKTRWLIALTTLGIMATSFALGVLLRFPVAPWMIFLNLALMTASLIGYFINRKDHDRKKINFYDRKKARKSFFFSNLFNVSNGFGAFALGTIGAYPGSSKLSNWSFGDGLMNVSKIADDPRVLSDGAVYGLSALLIFLLVVFLIGAVVGACSLLCNGYMAASIVLIAGGIPLIILGFVAAMTHIRRTVSMTRQDYRRKIRRAAKTILIAMLLIAVTIGIMLLILMP